MTLMLMHVRSGQNERIVRNYMTAHPSLIHAVSTHESMLNIGIIGGGIGGVSAAVALHRAGIQATVYERAPELREVGAGMMLWPNATRVLKDLGLLEKVAALSGPSRHFLVRGGAGAVLMDIALGRFDVPALCTRRADL